MNSWASRPTRSRGSTRAASGVRPLRRGTARASTAARRAGDLVAAHRDDLQRHALSLAGARSGSRLKSRIVPTLRNATCTTAGCIVWQMPAIVCGSWSATGTASRSIPRPIPMSHARRSTIARLGVVLGQRRVGPAHEAAAPRRLVERRLRDRRCPFQLMRHASRSSPSTHSRTSALAGLGIAAAGSRRRRRASSRPHAACVIAWHAVSNWCVQFCFGSVHLPGRGEAARERHARELAERDGRVGARRPRPAVRRVLARQHLLAVVARASTTKWWKSSSSSETTTPGSAVRTRIRRRYASAVEIEVGSAGSCARARVGPLAAG